MLARVALANYANSFGLDRIKASVARSLGSISGTHYVVAALHLAHLTLLFPHAHSSTQQALLLWRRWRRLKWRRRLVMMI
jgi:hypothetical protein